MRLPRVRLTVRRMMFVVAVVALASWWCLARPERFRRIAEHHEAEADKNTTVSYERLGRNVAMFQRATPRGEWHRMMAQKYRQAASRPWMPAGPDPPPPLPGQVLIRDDPFHPDFKPYFDYPRMSTVEGRRASTVRSATAGTTGVPRSRDFRPRSSGYFGEPIRIGRPLPLAPAIDDEATAREPEGQVRPVGPVQGNLPHLRQPDALKAACL